jgi:hypothetical protein
MYTFQYTAFMKLKISRLQYKKYTDLGLSNADKYMNDETCRFWLNKKPLYLLVGWWKDGIV